MILELEDGLCFIICIVLFPLYPLFYLIDFLFNTEIMFDGIPTCELYDELDND